MKALNGLWSPRLITLQQQLQNGNDAALTSFWQELETQGTPLVESQYDGQYLVTLVLRDDARHKPGELTCSLGGILTKQRFYLDVGMLEINAMGYGSPDGGLNAVESNRYMRNVLQAQGYEVTYVEYAGGHDMLWGGATLADGLSVLLNVHH